MRHARWSTPRSEVALSVVVACALAAGAAACSKEGEPGSCYRDRDNACVEYGRPQGAAGQRMCSGMKWIPGEKSCPTENRLGLCVKEKGTSQEYVYGGAPNNFTVSAAKNTCEWAGGVFTQAK